MPEPLTSNVTDVALIFEGGGMRASYTSAVVQVLLDEGLHLDWVAGISAGSTNTANYLARDGARARRSFVEFAGDPEFGGWGSFLTGKGYFNAHYIYEQTSLPGQALPYDLATYLANPARCAIGAFEADTGRTVYWGRDDLATLPDLMRKVRASSTMPILMPPVAIDGHVYVDGALGPSGGIALDAAKAAGFTRFFVVLTQERGYRKPPSRLPAAYRSWFRKLPAVADALTDRWRHYNATREELFDLERSGQALLFAPEQMAVRNHTRSVPVLQASYQAGLAQARREAPGWREWLGVG
ncbi:MAG: patatin family protein [Propionicimonas sp.]|uniref:patatin-like phospholipase family protein n=1 Tax=Propionicimonas sp. TaxID=1955623 RepID=UPI002B211DCD|nr:patatin family protein [Propionicimonas sp.]MEA4944993.1 patatin family protein [Propionicimonas sp.]